MKNESDNDKQLESIRKNRKAKGVGASSFEERELDEEAIKFCRLVATGLSAEDAGLQLGFSRYKIGKYPTYPNIQKEIEYWKERFSKSGAIKWVNLRDEIAEEAADYIKMAIRTKSMEQDKDKREAFQIVLKIFNERINALPSLKEKPQKGTKKITTAERYEQIEFEPFNENDDIPDAEITEEEE